MALKLPVIILEILPVTFQQFPVVIFEKENDNEDFENRKFHGQNKLHEEKNAAEKWYQMLRDAHMPKALRM